RTVYVFSVLAERIGSRELPLDCPTNIRAGDLLDQIASDHPAVAELRHVVRLAVNHEYVDEDHLVLREDEVALITPTSGG
ncbi:MAG: MoaD/ThiS family protein, partial [Rhodothermales bacterium]|nr:MoaD/ThiS family protein [Rhodothermales bacterium]